jgi:hypothetical protein
MPAAKDCQPLCPPLAMIGGPLAMPAAGHDRRAAGHARR